MAEATFKLTTEELLQLFDEQLPALLEERPELEPRIYHAFLKAFVRKEEFVALYKELTDFRAETRANFEQVDQRFEQVDQRFEQVDQRFERVEQNLQEHRAETRANFERVEQNLQEHRTETRANFKQVGQRLDELYRILTELGSRWGIYNEDVIRQLMTRVLEDSYGATVERKIIDGEEFDVVITDGEHILIEITARAKRNIQRRLERKRDLYTEKTGQTPTRVILAVGSIYSPRAQALREAGIEVIEPSEEAEAWSADRE